MFKSRKVLILIPETWTMILCMGISDKIEVATVAINEAMILKVKETIAIAIPIKSDNVNLSCQKVCFLRRCLHLAR